MHSIMRSGSQTGVENPAPTSAPTLLGADGAESCRGEWDFALSATAADDVNDGDEGSMQQQVTDGESDGWVTDEAYREIMAAGDIPERVRMMLSKELSSAAGGSSGSRVVVSLAEEEESVTIDAAGDRDEGVTRSFDDVEEYAAEEEEVVEEE